MRVGVTGATGFIGRALVKALVARGDVVTALTRDPSRATMPPGVAVVRFGGDDSGPFPDALLGMDAIVHLAGESVDGRWTEKKKRAIRESRVAGTRMLVRSLAAASPRPASLVCASASGYYGDRGDAVLDDDSPPGADFLAEVCVATEREARAAEALGVRVATVRASFVLGDGGAVAKLAPIVRRGLGGPLGSGRQWMPWIHIGDLIDAMCFVLDRGLAGPFVAVAPDYATNHRVMQALGNALGVPAVLPAPGFALRLVAGEFAESLLGGQLIVPKRLLDAGFVWKHPWLERALIDVVAPGSKKADGVQRFEAEQVVPAPLERVFAFFDDASNLARITPPAMGFAMATPSPIAMERGTVLDYTVRVRGMPVRWRSMVAERKPSERFSDVQVRGPFLLWRHTHGFAERKGGVEVRDLVEYALPFAPLSGIALPAVRRDIEGIFAYRRRAVDGIFGC